jgi:hypothetical protein
MKKGTSEEITSLTIFAFMGKRENTKIQMYLLFLLSF